MARLLWMDIGTFYSNGSADTSMRTRQAIWIFTVMVWDWVAAQTERVYSSL